MACATAFGPRKTRLLYLRWQLTLHLMRAQKLSPNDNTEAKRPKHHYWQVTVFYKDGETFASVYTDHAKATNFAARRKKSPVVKMARATEVS